MNVAVSSLSLYHQLSEKKIDVVDFPRICKKKFGVEAVELHHILFTSWDRAYIEEIKESLKDTTLVDLCLGISQFSTLDFSAFSASRSEEELKGVEDWLKIAKFLGSPFMRPDIGKVKANEETIQLAIQGYKKILPLAEREGVKILLENNVGSISQRAGTILQVIKEVNNPFLRALLDIGNFPLEILYKNLEKIAPFMSLAHIKTYEFDDKGKETTIDVGKCIRIFKKCGFDGFLCAEFVGKGDEYEGTEKTVRLIKSYI